MAKLDKPDVGYEMAKTGGDQCQDCKWFMPPRVCRWVAGTISAQGWCELHHRERDGHRGVTLGARQNRDRVTVRHLRKPV